MVMMIIILIIVILKCWNFAWRCHRNSRYAVGPSREDHWLESLVTDLLGISEMWPTLKNKRQKRHCQYGKEPSLRIELVLERSSVDVDAIDSLRRIMQLALLVWGKGSKPEEAGLVTTPSELFFLSSCPMTFNPRRASCTAGMQFISAYENRQACEMKHHHGQCYYGHVNYLIFIALRGRRCYATGNLCYQKSYNLVVQHCLPCKL